MFILHLFDSKGNELKIGDVVRIISKNHSNFYAEITYLEKESAIAPFHTFSFHNIEKIEKLPETAKKCNEERYNLWFDNLSENSEIDSNKYLLSWLDCESRINEGCFKITKNQ